MQHTTRHGFSLIELLVVVSIIALLATTALSSFSQGAAAARDAKRVADMEAIEGALFLFYQANGRYPTERDGVPDTGQIIGNGLEIDQLLEPYLSQIPKDPLHDAGDEAWPTAGSRFFYSYDPQHMIQTSPCPDEPGATYNGHGGTVFGFHRSETRGIVSRDTCWGSHLWLNDADYNKVLYPMAPRGLN